MAKVKARAAKAARKVEGAVEAAGEAAETAIKENVQRAIGAAAEFSSFGKGNLDAWVASTTATQKGVQALSARAMAYSKHALENHVAATRSLLTSKSVQEVVEKQTEYARSAFDAYVAELTRMSELMTGFAREAVKPLNQRVSAVSAIVQNGRVH